MSRRMPEPLRGALLERKAKKVVMVSSYRNYVPIAADEPYRSDLLDVIRRMEQGCELLPRHYRRDHDTTPDLLLERDGYKHIHLGRQSSDVLLFLMEFEDLIVLVEINSHRRFVGNPSGVNVGATHDVPVAKAFAEHKEEVEAAAPARDRAEALRLSLVAARRKAKAALKDRKPPFGDK